MLPATTFSGPRSLSPCFLFLTPEPTKRAAKRGARKHLKRPTRCAAEKGNAHVNQNAQTYPTTITITKYTTQHNYEYYELNIMLLPALGPGLAPPNAAAGTQNYPGLAHRVRS